MVVTPLIEPRNSMYYIFVLALLLSSCAYNETTNNYTITGDTNHIESVQKSDTSKPVQLDMAGSGYGSVSK